MKEIVIRPAHLGDVDVLVKLDELCWDKHLAASEAIISDRISSFAAVSYCCVLPLTFLFSHLFFGFVQGQHVADFGGEIVGVLYTRRISHLALITEGGSFTKSAGHHIASGQLVQLIAIAVQSSAVSMGNVASLLRSHALEAGRADPSVTRVVAMTRCSGYSDAAEFSSTTDSVSALEAYGHYVHASPCLDPTLFFHLSGGAQLLQVVHAYRPEDHANLGCAVLIAYDIRGEPPLQFSSESDGSSSSPSLLSTLGAGPPGCFCGLADEIVTWIVTQRTESGEISTPVGPALAQVPLLNLLDSLQLQTLHGWLRARVHCLVGAAMSLFTLTETFLFRYPTAAAVQKQLEDLQCAAMSGSKKDAAPAVDDRGAASAAEGVAIVGLALKFPHGLTSLAALWELLEARASVTGTQVPVDRWDSAALLAGLERSGEALQWDAGRRAGLALGSFVEAVDSFDPSYFGIETADAELMDPNHRLLLETVRRAIDGCARGAGNSDDVATSVYVAMSNDDPAAEASSAASLISQHHGWTGASMVLDVACSSSLVAIHEACRALRSGVCRRAVAAGVNLMLTPQISIAYARAGMLSPDGKCHTFDQRANGYVRGEGCGAVVLKRLSDARRDGDEVYGVIRGSAVMQDGKSASLTAPNGRAQEALMRAALSDAGVSAADVCYVEAHGTGTKLGDPIETEALSNVYGLASGRLASSPLYVGSVKANIGHLEAGAGMAGLFAAISVLKHGSAPANCHLQTLNPKVAATVEGEGIEFAENCSTLVGPRQVAGLSSFGYSGTIAHVLVESPASWELNNRE